MKFKAAVFCHNGLGDGVVTLVLSHQLLKNGWKVDTYHNLLGEMQSWFPSLPVFPYPSIEFISEIIKNYDWIFVVQNDASPFIRRLIQEGKKYLKNNLRVFYFIPSKKIHEVPYYSDTAVCPSLPIGENLRLFCKNFLGLSHIDRGNGIVAPSFLQHRIQKNRVVIHSTSSRPGLNWPFEKYRRLHDWLGTVQYEPVFVVHEKERQSWEGKNVSVTGFERLEELASFLYESGFFIGNNSGPGHLASSLQIPTLTLMRRKAYGKLWAPSFSSGIVVTPPSWIPNLRGFRWRDRYWQILISTRKAKRAFMELSHH